MAVRIYTARYQNKAIAGSGLLPIRITVGAPRFKLPYQYVECRALAPEPRYLKAPFDEFRRLYRHSLHRLGGVAAIVSMLESLAQVMDVVLLCYEDTRVPGNWCHRQILAEYLREHRIGCDELAEPETAASKHTGADGSTGGSAQIGMF